MRIISGKYKGRRIVPPNNITARPTTDFAKEGLFNLLNNRLDFEEISCLDLFSGTGSIALELASRDCKMVCCVEKNERHCAFIRKISADLKVENLELIKGDAMKFLAKTAQKFDLIFADPPYDLAEIEGIPDLVFSNDVLKPEGLFILEHSQKNNFENHPQFLKHRRYGNVNFSFFENKHSES